MLLPRRQISTCTFAHTQARSLSSATSVARPSAPKVRQACPLLPRGSGQQLSTTLSPTASLDKHNRTHTGERPFRCEFCEQRFTEKGPLLRHVASRHQEGRPHFCQICGKTFKGKRASRPAVREQRAWLPFPAYLSRRATVASQCCLEPSSHQGSVFHVLREMSGPAVTVEVAAGRPGPGQWWPQCGAVEPGVGETLPSATSCPLGPGMPCLPSPSCPCHVPFS